MTTAFEKMKQSWDGFLHGDTIGPYVLRRVIALGAVALLICMLHVYGLVSWQISMGLLIAATLVFAVRKRKAATPITSVTVPTPVAAPTPSMPVHKPAATHVVTTVSDDTDEMEPVFVDVGPDPKPVPQSVKDTHATLYDHGPRWMWLFERIAGLWLLLLALLVAIIYTDNQGWLAREIEPWLWDLLLLATAAVGFATVYYRAKWLTLRFVVSAESFSMPYSVFWPFNDDTPTVKFKDVTYRIRENWIDKLFHTARVQVAGKKDSEPNGDIDNVFNLVKWLPFPDELRVAIGSPPMRKSRRRLRRKR